MPDSLINRRLGRYHIQQEIGRGGMARVYRATDTLLQRAVALKILAPQIGNDPEIARRFEREAITAANLRHPAIITIFDVGEAEGLNYIAMEYIAGRTLHEVIVERGKLGLPLTVAVLTPVAEALQYAHSQGAIHRDVKPHNIMIDTDGRVVLTDFGIAIGVDATAERLTRAGSFMGTPEYLSPEQVQAEALTGRSDLYSLAVVAFEALTGRVPFEGATPQLIMAHVYSAPPAPSSIEPSLPVEVDPVLARALAKGPEARFERAPVFVEALRTIAERRGLPPAGREQVAALSTPLGSSAGQATIMLPNAPVVTPAHPGHDPAQQHFPIDEVFGPPAGVNAVSPIEEVWGPPQAPVVRRGARPAQGNAAAAPGTSDTRRARKQTPPALVYPRAEGDEGYAPPPPTERPPFAADRGGGLPWGAIVGLVGLLLAGILAFQTFRGDPGADAQPSGLGAVFDATPEPTVASEVSAVAATPSPIGPTPTAVPTEPAAVTAAPLPPEAPTATEAEPTVEPTPTSAPTATPEPAPTVAPTAQPSATVAPSATPEPSPTAPPPAAEPSPTLASATAVVGAPAEPAMGGGASIVVQSGPAINVLNVEEGTGIQIMEEADPIGPAAISPDGATILFDAVQNGKRDIFHFDRESGDIQQFTRGSGNAYHPSWSPDGKRVLFTSTSDGNPEIYMAREDGKGQERLTNDPADDDYPSWSADGEEIVWESTRDDRWSIFTMNQDGLRRLVRVVEGSDDRFPRISPDGTQVVFTSNRDRPDGGFELYLQPVSGGTPQRLTTLNKGTASGPQWSPDGQFIVFFSDTTGNSDIYIVRLDDGAVTPFGSTSADDRWPVWGP